MEDKFLIRVDEETPSDEKVAIKIIESGIGEELKRKVDMLLEKIDGIAATTNIEILREMKDILSGLLDSIASVSKKYSLVSEMILKLDEKILQAGKIDLTYLEDATRTNDEKLDQMADGLSKLLAEIQATLTSLNTDFATNRPNLERLEGKINEKFIETSISNAELNDKIENALLRNQEVMERLSVIDAMDAEMSVKLAEIKSDIEETASKISENINAAYMNNSEAIGRINEKIDAAQVTTSGLIEKINQRLDATYMNDADLTGKMNEIYVHSNEAFANMEGKLVRVNSEISGRIDDLSVSNAELIERARSLSSDLSAISERINEKIGEMSVINAEITEKIREIKADDVDKIRELSEKIGGISSDIDSVNEKISGDCMDRTEIIGRLDEISSGTAELIRGVEEKIGSAAANDIDVLARVDEKLSDMNARNKQLWDRLDEVARIGQKIDMIQDEMKSSVTSLADEIGKYQTGLKTLIKPKRARPRKKSRKARRKQRVSRRTRSGRPVRSKRQIGDEALDILIINTLKNVSMKIDSLSRATDVSETRLRKRMAVLMTRGVIAREKRGRYTFYVSRIDEASEMDN